MVSDDYSWMVFFFLDLLEEQQVIIPASHPSKDVTSTACGGLLLYIVNNQGLVMSSWLAYM